MDYQLLFTTCADIQSARALANDLVDKDLAACVSIIPNVTSIYKWRGEIEESQEFQLILKSHNAKFDAIKAFITDNHPYELPELIAVPITNGLPAYLDWIKEHTG